MKYCLTALFLCVSVSISVTATAQGRWTTVESFKGVGQAETTQFTIDQDKWRVYYKSEATAQLLAEFPDGAGHLFNVVLKSTGSNTYKSLVNKANEISFSGSTIVNKSGTFYFEVKCEDGSWKLKVQVQR